MQDKYLKLARFYPTISAMAIPAIVATAMCFEVTMWQDSAWNIVAKLLTFAPISAIFLALGFWLTEISRYTSLMLMEGTRFSSSGEKMPTTQMLVGEKPGISAEARIILASKLKTDFSIELPTNETVDSAIRQKYCSIVALIREATRENPILAQYNQEFGFCRNYIGASIVALIILVLLLVVAICKDLPVWYPIIGIVTQLTLMFFFWKALCISGDMYANRLFHAYISKK